MSHLVADDFNLSHTLYGLSFF